MAASDKNILISPQRGSATQSPSIRFTGDGNDPISIYALDGVPGSLSIEGSAGQLFSLTNNLTSGSIFSVNDVSGLPSIDVNASGLVQIAPFSGTLAIGKSTVTSGQTVDIKGNVRIDGNLTITSTANIANLNADLLDGLNSTQFLRSDASGTLSGALTLSAPSTQLILDNSGTADPRWGLYSWTSGLNIFPIDAASTIFIGRDGQVTSIDLYNFSTLSVAGTQILNSSRQLSNVTFGGNTIWHAGNDGAGSGLDADLLDGLSSGSFLRRDADDTWTGAISTTSTNGIRFGSANQTDTNDGYIAAGRFASGLNIIGTQTTAGTGRQVRIWGSVITDAGNVFWNAGNDGSGSGLDADLLDGINSSQFLRSDASATNSVDLRAPIFYDSNNTAYYTDPASTSNLGLVQTQDLRALGQVRATGWYGQNSGSHTGPAIEIGVSSPGSANGYIIAYNRDSGSYLNMNFNATAFTFGGQSGGFLTCDTSIRAPIFYDTANTAYYTDPASTSNLYGLTVNQVISGSISGNAATATNLSTGRTNWSTNGTISAVVGQLSWKNYGNSHTIFDASQSTSPEGGAVNNTNSQVAWTATYPTLMGWNGSNTYGVRVDSARISDSTSGSAGSVDFNNLTNKTGGTGTYTTSGDFRAPIFYDSNDTTYYLDPTSTGTSLKLAGNLDLYARSASWSEGIRVRMPTRSSWAGIRFTRDEANDNGNWAIGYTGIDATDDLTFYGNLSGSAGMKARMDLSAHFTVYGSVRSPIFYDSQDTNYYLNLNNFSRLDRLVLNQSRIDSSRFPVGHYASGDTVFEIDPSWTGDQLQAYFNQPVNWVDDSTAPGGYAIQVMGPVNVGGAYGSGFPYIPVDQDDVFYMEVWIKNVAGSNIHYMGSVDFNSGFGSLGGNPGAFGYWVMAANNPGTAWTKYSGYITGFGSSTGQFVSGTKYFTPLALFNYSGGTSYISGWKCIRTTHQGNRTIVGRSGSVTDNSNFALDIFHPTSYRQLRVRSSSHPLIKLSGDYNGGNGAEIWQNSSGTVIFNVNGSQSGVYVNPGPYTELLGSARSPAFYDSNDTSYYLDPNGSSQLYGVRANNWFRPQNETGLYSDSYGQHFYPDSAGFLWESDGPIRIRAGYEGGIQGTLGYHDSNGFGFLDDGGNWWLNTQNNEAHLVIGGSQALNAHSSATGRRLMFGGGDADAQGNYYIGTNQENYGGSYNKLDLRWHTGIRMGAQPIYGGIRFYDTEDLGTQVFAIGKDGSYAQANQSMRAPIFYDLDNTGYYLDPASTSYVNSLQTFGSLTVGNSTSSDIYMTDSDEGSRRIHCNSSRIGFLNESNGWGAYCSDNGDWTTDTISYAGASHRSPIFYDSGNTAYYTDPASTSNLNGLTVAGTISGSVSGNSGTVGGLSVHGGRNNEADKVVRTNASGYLDVGWINTTSGNLGVETRLDRVYCSNDAYVRYLGLTDFKNQMGLSSKNSYSRRVDYTSDANYWVGSFGHGGYGANETFHGGSGFWDIWSGTNYPGGLTHIHGFNALHYTTSSLGTTGGTAYGWQMAAQYDTNNGPWWRRCNAGGFSGWLKLVSYGNNQSGDIYASAYYDHNDTGYYADPQSEYISLRIGGAIVGNHTTWTGEQNKIQWHSGNLYFQNTSDSRFVFRNSNGAEPVSLYASGYGEASASWRAPVFYDSNNTGYYTDPASTSNLNALTVNNTFTVNSGWTYVANNYGYGIVGLYASTVFQLVFAMGDAYKTTAGGGINNLYGIAWSHPNAGGIAGNLNTHGALITENGAFLAALSGSIRCRDDMRAPIFYDSNNTGYYCDPASTSNLNSVSMQGGNVYGVMYFHANRNTTSDSPPLQAYSTNGSGAIMSFHRGGYYAVNFGLDSDNVMRIGGWSASANRWQLDMSGNMTAAGNVTAYSDIRLKDNIKPIDNALEKTLQLNGVTFTRKDQEDKEKRHAGVIAQEVEKVLPEVVSEDNEGIKNVAYGNMVGLLIEAIKDQQKMIEELRKEVDNLKKLV